MEMNEKKEYKQPQVKVVVLDACDIIADSNTTPDDIGVNLRD